MVLKASKKVEVLRKTSAKHCWWRCFVLSCSSIWHGRTIRMFMTFSMKLFTAAERKVWVYISSQDLSTEFPWCKRVKQLLWCWLHGMQTLFCCLGKHRFNCGLSCSPFLAKCPLFVELHANVLSSIKQRLILFREKIVHLHRMCQQESWILKRNKGFPVVTVKIKGKHKYRTWSTAW